MSTRVPGFSLIEVMVAIVVFSLGLLGAAMLATSAVKNGHNAYLRSQASLLADSIAERMRANPRGVWAKDYVGALSGTSPALPTCGSGTGKAGCDAAGIAQRDRAVMGKLIAQQLPGGSGSIACTLTGALPATSFGVAPVDGSCTIAVSWTEQRDVDKEGYGGTQTFELVVQP
jgi:type IV pilus assembly protein PilV